MLVTPIGPPTQPISLPQAQRPESVAAVTATPQVVLVASEPKNLSQAAYPVYQSLQAAATIPPSSDPMFVPPANGNALRLYSAVQAIAAERVYPAPVFSFSA